MSRTAYLFPGQASQFVGMGKNLYESHSLAKDLFEEANEILGFRISDVMFSGTEDQLKQTNITQPSVFIHSIVSARIAQLPKEACGVAGHSLGEFSALVAAGVLSFQDGLRLVQIRSEAMQSACEINPGTMAAVVGLTDEQIENVCSAIKHEIVIPANYNCPGQLVISGSIQGINFAEQKLLEAGAKKVIILQVGGAFHSPLMEPARLDLEKAILDTHFSKPNFPVYQNFDALAHSDPNDIKNNLVAQLTSPVKWTQIMLNMISDGAQDFVEVGGNGMVLSGFLKRIDRNIKVVAI
ncbi:MAG: ACP S-malonyltransferase [Saprospiraceae bacterium]|nr:ACP S-malonyltransferase [Saprospiraceae bacterium]